MTDFRIVMRSLTTRAFSTATTAVMVGVSVALMLTLLTMRDAGRNAFERGSGNMHLLISRDASPLVSVLNGVFYAGAPARPISWDEYEQLAASLPFDFAIPTQLGDSYKGLPVLATTTEFFTKFQPIQGLEWSVVEGRLFQKPFEIVMGAEAAQLTGARVGDTLYVTHGAPGPRRDPNAPEPHVHTEFTYTVVGVLGPTGTLHDRAAFSDLTSSWILHAHDRRLAMDSNAPLTTEADLLPEDMLITGVMARLWTREGSDASAALPQVFEMIRSRGTFTVASPTDQIGRLFAIVSNVDRVLVGIAAVVMVSSAVAIMLAIYNSMEQRRRQIAVLRVLGCSRGRVFGLIVTESAMIGMLGAALGVVLAVVGGAVVAAAMKHQLGLTIDGAIGPRPAVVVSALTVILAGLAGTVPAAMAYRSDVARNLRPLG